MERTFEAVLVEQCAPTLMGIKPASLFRYQAATAHTAWKAAAHWGRELAPYGIGVRVLKTCPHTDACLVYLYRIDWLRKILTEPENHAFLRRMGYQTEGGCDDLLGQLSDRLCLEQAFPHEIGLFLGYPLEDVIGFIENQGRNFTFCGCWKVYGDPRQARRRFAQYRHCTTRCVSLFSKGIQITQLVASA